MLGGYIAVMPVDMLDGESHVVAERQQPTTNEHRDRFPSAMRQLVRRDRSQDTDHEAGKYAAGEVVPKPVASRAASMSYWVRWVTHAPNPNGSPEESVQT